jgi:hypothetical protein
VSMNSGQEASPDLPDDEAVDPAEAADVDPKDEALQRSQDAIDEGREAAREALQDNPPDADPSEPGNPES